MTTAPDPRRPRAFQVLFSVLLLIAAAGACFGQEDRGRIVGTVKDATGALVAEADVRAVNRDTGLIVRTKSGSGGVYALDYLIPGDYDVIVEQEGFKRFERTGLSVRVGDRVVVDASLELGSVTEKVVVTAAAPLLESATSSVGTVIEERQILDLPMADGNAFMLQFTAPGIVPLGPAAYTTLTSGGPSQATVNGARSYGTEFQLDGVPNTHTAAVSTGRSVAFQPSAHFLQQYKVQTTSYDASIGSPSGASVNSSIKSGTNAIHGSAYYYAKPNALRSNLFFNNSAGQPKPGLEYNRWALNAGGPAVKNKLFWFGGYEKNVNITPAEAAATVQTVPTTAQKQGNFAELLALGSQYQLYDPETTRSIGGGRYQRDPFPGNILPASRITEIGKKIVGYYPDPNQAGGKDGSNNHRWGAGTQPVRYQSAVGRADYYITEAQRIFVRGVWSDRYDTPMRNHFPGASGTNYYVKNLGGALDYLNTITPTVVLNVKYGYTRRYVNTVPITIGFDITTLGMPAWLRNQMDPEARAFPRINPTGVTSLNTENRTFNTSDTHSLGGTLSKMYNRHMLRFGVEGRTTRENYANYSGENGNFTFGGGLNGPYSNSAAPPMGAGIAGLLLDRPSSGQITKNSSYAASNPWMGLYVHDDWSVSSRLTVNIGVRYEYESALAERHDRTVRGFAYDAVSPINDAARANYAKSPLPERPLDQFNLTGGITFAGVNGEPHALWEAPRRNFMPRIGFAYILTPMTVLRGGYGIFFDGIAYQDPIQSGFTQQTYVEPSLGADGMTFRSTLANPFPDGILAPPGNSQGLATFLGKPIQFFNTKPRTPYNQIWSFGLQRQFFKDVVLETNYVGSRGTALTVTRDINAAPGQYYSTSLVRDQATINALSKSVPNPFYPMLPDSNLSSSNTTVAQLLRPRPQYTSIQVRAYDGYSWYHSLQTRLEKRLSQGWRILGSWTWSKNMEATEFLNAFDARPSETISANDRTHRLSLTTVYDLPFGRGRLIGSGLSGAANKIVGGWKLSAIFDRQSGAPIGLGNFIYYGDARDIVLPAGERTRERWFNTANFESNSQRQLSYNVRYQPLRFSGLRADRYGYLDLSLAKSTSITERFKLDLRLEARNSLNETIFNAPNTTLTSSSFGVVTSAQTVPRTFQYGIIFSF